MGNKSFKQSFNVFNKSNTQHSRVLTDHPCPNCHGTCFEPRSPNMCLRCFGTGIELAINEKLCPKCVGKLRLIHYVGKDSFYVQCDMCNGRGLVTAKNEKPKPLS